MTSKRKQTVDSADVTKRQKYSVGNMSTGPRPEPYRTESGRSSKKPDPFSEAAELRTMSAEEPRARSAKGSDGHAPENEVLVPRGRHYTRQDNKWVDLPPLMAKAGSIGAQPALEPPNPECSSASAATLLGLPLELRNQIYKLVMQSDYQLMLCDAEEAVLIRNAPAELLRLRQLENELSALIAIRDTRINEMNALQKYRLQDIDAMDLATGLDDAQDAVDNPTSFFDTSLIRVNRQINTEAKGEFLRVNRFQFIEEPMEEPELKDGNHHPRRYNELGEAMLAHSTNLEMCVPWHDLPLLSTRLRHRNNLKLLDLHLIGPLENKYELETFLRFLRVVHATKVRLTWVEPLDSDLEDRESQVDDALVKDSFDSAIAEMQSGGVSAEVQGEQYPPRFRGFADESAQ